MHNHAELRRTYGRKVDFETWIHASYTKLRMHFKARVGGLSVSRTEICVYNIVSTTPKYHILSLQES